jgi:hypothetical protein
VAPRENSCWSDDMGILIGHHSLPPAGTLTLVLATGACVYYVGKAAYSFLKRRR